MSSQAENYLTIVLSPIAAFTGYMGLTLSNVDLVLAIAFKLVSIVSVLLIIAVNWKKGLEQIKEWIKWKE